MYTKLYSTILDSSIWSRSDATRLVWVTMLAMATKNGMVHASIDGLARRANISLELTRQALDELASPDEHDKSGVQSGCRIVQMQGCWQLINFEFYREAKSIDAVRKQQWRERQADPVTVTNVPDIDPSSRSAPAPDQFGLASPPAQPARKTKRQLPEDFEPSDAHRKLAAKLCVSLDSELPSFRDHHLARGNTMLDWGRALNTWIRNAAKFAARQGGKGPGRFQAAPGSTSGISNGWRPDQRHRELLARLQRDPACSAERSQLHAITLDQLAGEFIRSGALGDLAGELADRAFAAFIKRKAQS